MKAAPLDEKFLIARPKNAFHRAARIRHPEYTRVLRSRRRGGSSFQYRNSLVLYVPSLPPAQPIRTGRCIYLHERHSRARARLRVVKFALLRRHYYTRGAYINFARRDAYVRPAKKTSVTRIASSSNFQIVRSLPIPPPNVYPPR